MIRGTVFRCAAMCQGLRLRLRRVSQIENDVGARGELFAPRSPIDALELTRRHMMLVGNGGKRISRVGFHDHALSPLELEECDEVFTPNGDDFDFALEKSAELRRLEVGGYEKLQRHSLDQARSRIDLIPFHDFVAGHVVALRNVSKRVAPLDAMKDSAAVRVYE